jgi:hypothetical protein
MPPAQSTLSPARARPSHPIPVTEPVEFRVGDRIGLRKPHPCGGRTWDIDRLGADLGLRCTTCRRHVLLERREVERRLVEFVSRGPGADAG